MSMRDVKGVREGVTIMTEGDNLKEDLGEEEVDV
jgi:hypothetical protein